MADDGLAREIYEVDPIRDQYYRESLPRERGWHDLDDGNKEVCRRQAQAATAYFFGADHKGTPAKDSGRGLVEAVQETVRIFDGLQREDPRAVGGLDWLVDKLEAALKSAGEEVT